MNAVRMVQTPVYRDVRVNLGINGAHSLSVGLGAAATVFDRDRAHQLGDALAAVADHHALALLSAFAPLSSEEDVQCLRRAIAAFEEELAFEDRRPEPRSHRATKIVAV